MSSVYTNIKNNNLVTIAGFPPLRRESYKKYVVRRAMEAHEEYKQHPERTMSSEEFKQKFNGSTVKKLGLKPLV